MFLRDRFFAEKKTKQAGLTVFGFGNGMFFSGLLLTTAIPLDPLLFLPAVVLTAGGAVTATAGGVSLLAHSIAHH